VAGGDAGDIAVVVDGVELCDRVAARRGNLQPAVEDTDAVRRVDRAANLERGGAGEVGIAARGAGKGSRSWT